jgi:hypothetical protein
MMIDCMGKSKAAKRYTKRTLVTMSVYVVLVYGTTFAVRHEHVKGWWLYVCAVLPALAILWLLRVVALYLKEETDEFVRAQMVVSILWATAAILAVSAVSDFLRSYTPYGTLPTFTVFVTFWFTFSVAQVVQRLTNRAGRDE